MLAVEHLLLVFREFHCHGYLLSMDCVSNVVGTDYPLRVIVTVAFWPTFGRVDLHPVAGLDGRDRVLVQACPRREFHRQWLR